MLKVRLLVLSATVAIVHAPSIAEQRTATTPLAGTEQIKTVGSVIFERMTYESVRAPVLTSRLKVGRLEIPANAPLFRSETSKKLKLCFTEYSCMFDEDEDGKVEKVDSYFGAPKATLAEPIPYEERDVPALGKDYYTQEIRYAGSTGDTLRLSYREFTKQMARPAFSEELALPIGKSFPQQVAFKDIKMTILSIDGMGMRYRIEQ